MDRARGEEEEFRAILERASSRCASRSIALSGGLDSSAIAYCLRRRRPDAYAVIARGFAARDLTYCQTVASRLGLPLRMVEPGAGDIVGAVDETVRILGNFNDIEIRNSVAIYLAVRAVRDAGGRSVITGDGADELFAGYGFMLKKSGRDLEEDLARMLEVMHFPSRSIGGALGVSVEAPFLDGEMVEFAAGLPAGRKVGGRGGRTYGKMPVRRAMEGRLPAQVVWREKVAAQDGAGTAGLAGLFESAVPDGAFAERRGRILEEDGIRIRTKESLCYYQSFRRFFGRPRRGGAGRSCPDCGHGVGAGSRFCRMCGRFPV